LPDALFQRHLAQSSFNPFRALRLSLLLQTARPLSDRKSFASKS
jgi:hypothetical protein